MGFENMQNTSGQFGYATPQLDIGLKTAEQLGLSSSGGIPQAGGQQSGSWGLWDSIDPKTGMKTQGVASGIVGAAGAISNAYLGYQGLQEARRNREMQEKYAATNLYNQAQGYNANVRDVGANNAAINGWSGEQQQQYVSNNQARGTIG